MAEADGDLRGSLHCRLLELFVHDKGRDIGRRTPLVGELQLLRGVVVNKAARDNDLAIDSGHELDLGLVAVVGGRGIADLAFLARQPVAVKQAFVRCQRRRYRTQRARKADGKRYGNPSSAPLKAILLMPDSLLAS